MAHGISPVLRLRKANAAQLHRAIGRSKWKIIDSQRFEAGADLRAAMNTAIERIKAEGWRHEGAADFGFVFIRDGNERRLVALTPKDPRDTGAQSFNLFR